MSNSKKKDVSVDLNFEDMDGGTVQKEEAQNNNLPAVAHQQAEQTTEEKPQQNYDQDNPEQVDAQQRRYKSKTSDLDSNDICLPIPMEDGSYQNKDICDVSGEEFIAWIKNSWPMSEEWNPDPSKFDGPKRTNKRIKYFWNVVERHEKVHEVAFRLAEAVPGRNPQRIKDILN